MAEPMSFSSPPAEGALLHLVFLLKGSERVHAGTLSMHPSVGLRNLKQAVTDMIGVPPIRMRLFEVRPTFGGIIIDEKMDLSVVPHEDGDWMVLAVVQLPGNGRNCRGREVRSGSEAIAEDFKPQAEKTILRGNDGSKTPVIYYLMDGPVAKMRIRGPFYQPLICYLRSGGDGSVTNTFYIPETEGLWRGTGRGQESSQATCAVCEAAANLGAVAAFHGCARDVVLEVGPFFRTRWGPIERPPPSEKRW